MNNEPSVDYLFFKVPSLSKRPSFKLLDSLQQEVCITYLNHLLWWFCLWICSIDGSIRNKENQFEQTNKCLDDSQVAKLIFFLVIKELSKHVQWAKCRLLVFKVPSLSKTTKLITCYGGFISIFKSVL